MHSLSISVKSTSIDYFELVAEALSRTYFNQGLMYWQTKEYEKGETAIRESIAITARLAHQAPNAYSGYFTGRMSQFADSLYRSGRLDKLPALHHEYIDFWKAEFDKEPSPTNQKELLNAYRNQLNFLGNNRMPADQIIAAAMQQRQFLEDLADLDNNPAALFQLSKVLGFLADLSPESERLHWISQAIDCKEAVYRLVPDDLQVQLDLAYSWADYAEELMQLSTQRAAGAKYYHQSNDLLQQIAKDQKDESLTYKRAINHHRLASLTAVPDSIIYHIDQSISLQEQLLLTNPNDYELTLSISQAYLDYGEYLLNTQKEIEKASTIYLKALPHLQKLAASEEGDRAAFSLAKVYFILAKMTDDAKELAQLTEASIGQLEGLHQRHPKELEIALTLAEHYMEYADYLVKIDKAKRDRGRDYFQKALTILKPLLQQERRPAWLNSTANVYETLALIEINADQRIAYKKEELALREELHQALPANREVLVALSKAYLNMCWYQLLDKQYTQAEQYLEKGKVLDDAMMWVYTMPPLLELLQGNYQKAKAYYSAYKDKVYQEQTAFKDAFLEDFQLLESNGFQHPDIEKIRQLLQD